MERRREIQRAMYAMTAVDTTLVFLLVVVFLRWPSNRMILAAVCFPALLIFNFIFLRRKLRMVGPPTAEEGARAHAHKFSLYGGSAIFFAGTLYGLLMISQGELPRTVLPLLLIPLSLAVYSLRVARRSAARKPKPDDAEPN